MCRNSFYIYSIQNLFDESLLPPCDSRGLLHRRILLAGRRRRRRRLRDHLRQLDPYLEDALGDDADAPHVNVHPHLGMPLLFLFSVFFRPQSGVPLPLYVVVGVAAELGPPTRAAVSLEKYFFFILEQEQFVFFLFFGSIYFHIGVEITAAAFLLYRQHHRLKK